MPQLVGPFADAAFALAVGQMSQPVRTQVGYHLILCEGRKA
jgi:parvulin-like peptidyl-prolyl isomerase